MNLSNGMRDTQFNLQQLTDCANIIQAMIAGDKDTSELQETYSAFELENVDEIGSHCGLAMIQLSIC
jgi:capsular polysaccharide biosynthesis protein